MKYFKSSSAAYVCLLVICIVIAAFTIRDYRMAFNGDTYTHALLLPEIMVSEGRFLLDDFPYSNGDNRTIAIAAVHSIPMAIFRDNPWLAYVTGSLFLSFLYILTIARSGMKLKTPFIVMAPLLLYVSLSPSYPFYEHIHGQNSYIIEQTVIFLILATFALYLGSNAEDRKPQYRNYWIAGLCIVLAGATGINRTLVTLYAPIIFAIVGCKILLLGRERITRRDFKAFVSTLFAMVIGVVTFKLIESQINYTFGAARPLSLSNWRGQTESFAQMFDAVKRLLSLWTPSGRPISLVRDAAAAIIVVYILAKSFLAIWQRKSAVQIMATLFLIGITTTLAVAFNLTDIKATARYMLPFVAATIFALMVFTAHGSKAEQWVIAISITCLAAWSVNSVDFRRNHFKKSETLDAKIQAIIDASDVDFGLTSLNGSGMRNLSNGVGSFIPVQISNEGNMGTLPFHSELYYRDYEEAERTALIYSLSRNAGATNKILDEFLGNNNYKVIQDETVSEDRSIVRVLIVEGDLRTVFPGSTAITDPARRFVSERTLYKGGSIASGQSCKTHIDVPAQAPIFHYVDTGFMVFPGTYVYRPVFDSKSPEDETLLLAFTTGTEGKVYRERWSGEEVLFTITKPGILRMMLFGKNVPAFQFCGAEVRRLSKAE